MNENIIESLSVYEYKNVVKTTVSNAAFKELDYIKEGHSKVEHNYYSN